MIPLAPGATMSPTGCSRPGPSPSCALLLALAIATTACEEPAGIEVRQIRIFPEVALVLLGDTEIFTLQALGSAGAAASAAGVQWSSTDATVASVGADGLVSVASPPGRVLLIAQLASAADTVRVEVYDPPDSRGIRGRSQLFRSEGLRRIHSRRAPCRAVRAARWWPGASGDREPQRRARRSAIRTRYRLRSQYEKH